jgi:hypothetical protein
VNIRDFRPSCNQKEAPVCMKLYYGIWCEVRAVTGLRHSWLKSNGAYKRFATREEAAAEAASLNKSMNGPNAKASFRYTATILGDADDE